MTIKIEITDPELALQVLSALDAIEVQDKDMPDNLAHLWLDEITLKIQQALHEKAEKTFKHLSSFERFYAEINEFGDVRMGGRVWKPEFSKVYDSWVVRFPDNRGNPVNIDPIHFVKVYFDKDLELD